MKRKKPVNKQERLNLVSQFLKSGQSQKVWCKAYNILPSTFSKWLQEYKRSSGSVKFVELKPQNINDQIGDSIDIASSAGSKEQVLVEIGPCKFHVSEETALTFMSKALEVSLANV